MCLIICGNEQMENKIMKEVKIYKDVPDIETKLDELGFTVEELQEAARANFLAQASCTPNDAPTAAGSTGWFAAVRVLREFLTLKGWKRPNIKNSPRILHPSGDFSVMFATGNDATGNPILTPRTKSNKGATTRDSINKNALQASLFEDEMIPHVVPIHKFKEASVSNNATWVFLVYVHVDRNPENPKHIIRCELSLPVNMDDAGYINSWSERIIIPEIDINSNIDDNDNDKGFAPEQEIILKPK